MSKNINAIARICHEANRAYCVSMGDNSQVSWDEAPEWQRKSAVNGVIYHKENPDSQACDSHNNWLKEKRESGWKYGVVKNPEKKEHPCFVEFKNLPKAQQLKDSLFLAIVRVFSDTPSASSSPK